MVEQSVQQSVRAVILRDNTLAQSVIEGDPKIDEFEVDLEEDCLKILALHQPVAVDLRFLVALLKINNDLERIGDLAVNIAKRTKELARFSEVPVPFDLDEMLSLTLQMVKDSADSLIDRDTDKARQIGAQDDRVDELHKEAYRNIQEKLCQQPELTAYYISLLSVSRNLERIADHATNIGEDVIYLVEGKIVRHSGA